MKGISFHVPQKACFGLLGVNGAGKTSTFHMLTGESRVSAGEAYINGIDIRSGWRQVHANVNTQQSTKAGHFRLECLSATAHSSTL